MAVWPHIFLQEVDDSTCLRFLKARSMHISKAAKMYVQFRTWRASFVPLGYIPIGHITSELNANKCALQGYSKKGYPLMIAFAANHYPAKSSLETFKKYVVHILDKTIASTPAGTEKITVIVDLKHLSYKNVDLKGYIAAFQFLQNYYPERLADLYMVNVPKFFHGIWKVVSRFLDQPTNDKIRFLSHDIMREVLLSVVDVGTLPSDYGGKADFIFIQDVHVPNFPGEVTLVPT
ncbi:hypothetical protein KP509_33G058000 [Ceratopteris richardii]|uniref:CRAL-TRIO domain-containing protein n=1 Tax=Ceratopteris richardii TaxID=49495 RepID=A0A8T2QQ44_CERRI|nr:hypothetical protein KP509_33G058000 [Ceratopteris richardii]